MTKHQPLICPNHHHNHHFRGQMCKKQMKASVKKLSIKIGRSQIYDKKHRAPRYHNLSLKYLPINHHHHNFRCQMCKKQIKIWQKQNMWQKSRFNISQSQTSKENHPKKLHFFHFIKVIVNTCVETQKKYLANFIKVIVKSKQKTQTGSLCCQHWCWNDGVDGKNEQTDTVPNVEISRQEKIRAKWKDPLANKSCSELKYASIG